MPNSRLYKPSELDKRFKILSQQLYGKSEDQIKSDKSEKTNEPIYRKTGTLISPDTPVSSNVSDLTYLKHDLSKIALLTTLAIGTQIILYIGLTNHIIRLTFLR